MKHNQYGWILSKTKGIRVQLALYTLMVLCVPALQIAFSLLMKLFIDIATGSLTMPLLWVVRPTLAVVVIGGILMLLNAVLSKWIYGKMECNLRAELMDIILSRRMIDIAKQHTGGLLTKLTVDVQAVSLCPAAIIDNMAGGAVSALLATAALFFLNWKIAIILLVLTPLLMLVMGALTPHIQQASAKDKGNDEANRSLIQENLSRIMLIKTYFLQKKTLQKVRVIYKSKMKSGMKLGLWEGLATFTGTLFGNVMSMVTLGLGAYFVPQGETTVGSLIMIIQLLNYIVNPVSKFSAAIAQVGQAVASAGRIGMLEDLPADQKCPAVTPEGATELIVKDLYFSYGSGDESRDYILNGVNLSCQRGQVTGIVGKSGSGKSTLLKLMIGLYTPESGTVALRHAAGVLKGEELMPQAAYVPPADYLFSGSVSDNIVMSEDAPRHDALRAAASHANILDFIQALPHGFDTELGEGGVSSGQAQRIAIARAIYKKAFMVVFDEPTANLDEDSIKKFQSIVKEIAKEKICVIVTHDVSTMAVCDKIYELSEGGITEKQRDVGDEADIPHAVSSARTSS